MEFILNMLAKVLEAAANFTAASTSIIMLYQPEKPNCLKNDEKR